MQVTMYPVPIIPEDWSPEQAIAVYEFLDKVRERIWDRYQEPIIEQFQINCVLPATVRDSGVVKRDDVR
jgi:hypothetical protein